MAIYLCGIIHIINKMKIQTSNIECPECGSSEIHYEADYSYERLLSLVCRQNDEVVSTEPDWGYCLNCGLMFDPMQKAFAV